MAHCLICKELVNNRYSIKVMDEHVKVRVDSHVCRDCWNNLLASHNDEGFFKISKLLAWTKGKKDSVRHL
ncbi:MAG: hypothetical protein ACE5FW_01030 [Candidatus Aenigmatarchaeota archaeon]